MTKRLAFILSASLAACAGQAEVHYAGNAAAPEMVTMDTDPSVMVIANADEPLFYTENTYWLYRGDHWYRSSSHRGGWARVDTPPEHVRRITRPQAYVHFRHSPEPARTTFNQREQVAPQPRDPYRERTPAEPDPQQAPRYPNPLPPQQVPPASEHDPILERPMPPHAEPMVPRQVPPANPDRLDRPDHQIAPDPDRAPTSPGMQNRARDQRPAADRDDRRDEPRDRDQDERHPDAKY